MKGGSFRAALVLPERKFTLAHRTTNHVDTANLRLHGPALDFEGYWLFAPLREDTFIRGIKMGFSVGRYEGTDLALKVPGDPNNVLYVVDLITDTESISYSTDKLSRAEVSSSPSGFDIVVGSLGRICGNWPHFQFRMLSPQNSVDVNLQMYARNVHWWPDIVMPRTTYQQFVLPDTEVTGTVSCQGKTYEISGIGAFDRPFGRLVASPTSRGVGYWHYDVIMWDEQFSTVSWLVADKEGKPLIAYGMGNLGYPDLLLFEHFKIEYLEFEERGEGRRLPRKWKGTLSGEDGTFTYNVRAVGQEYNPNKPDSSFLSPNLLMHCEGRFTHKRDVVRELLGVGLPEYHVAYHDPLI